MAILKAGLATGADKPLLSDCSLELPPASMGLVYGRSGAGKTTLLQVRLLLCLPSDSTNDCMLQPVKKPVLLLF